jgi:type II secretory pathway pseudopilin PulG
MGGGAMSGAKQKRQQGFSVLETMIAILVLTVGLVAVLGIFGFAIKTNGTQGNFATRTTQYAQSKMEQLMALEFSDTTSSTIGNETSALGGTGLTPGGSVTAGAAVVGYVDYIDGNGDAAQAGVPSSGLYYSRQWQITSNADGTLTVAVLVRAVGVPSGATPNTVLASVKANF